MPWEPGNEFQVGPRAAETLSKFPQALVGDARLAVVEQGVAIGRAAAASGIGRVRVPDKQLGTIDNHGEATFSEDHSNVAPQPAPDKGASAPGHPGTRHHKSNAGIREGADAQADRKQGSHTWQPLI